MLKISYPYLYYFHCLYYFYPLNSSSKFIFLLSEEQFFLFCSYLLSKNFLWLYSSKNICLLLGFCSFAFLFDLLALCAVMSNMNLDPVTHLIRDPVEEERNN